MLRKKTMNAGMDHTLFYLFFPNLSPKAERTEAAWRFLLVYLPPASLLLSQRGFQFWTLASLP